MNDLIITELTVVPVPSAPGRALLGFVRLVFNDCLLVTNIKIIDMPEGVGNSWPREYNAKNQRRYNVVAPTGGAAREHFDRIILDEYWAQVKAAAEAGKVAA